MNSPGGLNRQELRYRITLKSPVRITVPNNHSKTFSVMPFFSLRHPNKIVKKRCCHEIVLRQMPIVTYNAALWQHNFLNLSLWPGREESRSPIAKGSWLLCVVARNLLNCNGWESAKVSQKMVFVLLRGEKPQQEMAKVRHRIWLGEGSTIQYGNDPRLPLVV